jgi:ABC-type branched-subunit amino acid transport system substrate-binding protein
VTSTIEQIFEPLETRAGRIRRMRKRIGLGIAAVVLVAATGWAASTLYHTCGWLGSGVYQVGWDRECVGVTDGSYVFDSAFNNVQKKIADENDRVLRESSSYVTVALLDLLTPTATSAKSTEKIRSELEGAYTAQRRINESILPTNSSPQIRLVLANHGNTPDQWKPVADQLVEMTEGDHLVAVIGLGVSTVQTRRRAETLSSHKIPMVASIITADELDYTHIPGLIRVSPTTQDYAKALRRYVETRNDLRSAVVVHDMNSNSGDLFTKSLKEDLEQQMGHLIKGRPPLPFFGASFPGEAGPGRFDIVTPNICSAPPTDVVIYAGRQVDLDGFLQSLAGRQCRSAPLTVITAADIGTLLSEREQQLSAANLTVVHAGTSDTEGWGRGVAGTPQNYGAFLSAFQAQGFNDQNLNDSEAIMMHDALLTAAQAVLLAHRGESPPTAANVGGVLLNLNGQYQVQGASGTLSFSASPTGAGNPRGKPVPLLKFPSPPGDPSGQQVALPPYVTQ